MNRYAASFCLLLLVVLLLQACGCPPDEKVGEIAFQSETQRWIPYRGNERLRFVSLAGDTIFLENRNGAEQNTDKLCVKTICTENEIKGQSFCEYFDAESRRFIFQDESDSLLVDLLYYSEVYDGDSRRFVDIMRVSLSWGTPSLAGEKLLAMHFEGGLDTTRLSLLPELEYLGKLKLGPEYYDEVYSVVDANLGIWFSPLEGLVGFSRLGDLYRLDRDAS